MVALVQSGLQDKKDAQDGLEGPQERVLRVGIYIPCPSWRPLEGHSGALHIWRGDFLDFFEMGLRVNGLERLAKTGQNRGRTGATRCWGPP